MVAKTNSDGDLIEYLNMGEASPMFSVLAAKVMESNAKSPRSQWLSTISKMSGVKKSEIFDSGVLDWLSQGSPDEKLTREEVYKFITTRLATIKEIVLAKPRFAGFSASKEGKYHEVLFTLVSEKELLIDQIDEVEWKMNEVSLRLQSGDFEDFDEIANEVSSLEAERASLMSAKTLAYDFKEHHFSGVADARNLVAHARYTVMDSGVFMVNEIQSDWGQRGRKYNWRGIPRGPLVTDTEAWRGFVLRRLMQKAASMPEVHTFAWITQSMRNGGRQNIESEKQDMERLTLFNNMTKEIAARMLEQVDIGGDPAQSTPQQKAARSVVLHRAAAALADRHVEDENEWRSEVGGKARLTDAESKQMHEQKCAEFVLSMTSECADADAQKAQSALIADGIREVAKKQAKSNFKAHENIGGLNVNYVIELPKIADKILSGTDQKMGFIAVKMKDYEASVPGFQMTESARQRLSARMPVYSPTTLLRAQPLERHDRAVKAAVQAAHHMLGNRHAVRLMANIFDDQSRVDRAASLSRGIISLSLRAQEPTQAVAHECMHYALEYLLDQRERDLVLKAFAPGSALNSRVMEVARKVGDTGVVAACATDAEEAAAQGFAYWFEGKMELGPESESTETSGAAKVFASMKAALKGVVQWFIGQAQSKKLETVDDVFTHLADGGFAEVDGEQTFQLALAREG